MRNNKYSDYKILHFNEKIDSFKQEKVAAPIYVRVKPINLCNHGCFFCIYSTGFRAKDKKENHIISGMHTDMVEKDTIPTEKMFEILDDFKEIGVRAVTYSGGGEPLIHKDIANIMQRTLDYDIDLSVITNGQMLNGKRAEVLSQAKWVRISMDYVDAAQMMEFRNVSSKSFEEVLNNIEAFAKIKNSDCDLSVNYIIHKGNYKGLYGFAKSLKERGVENIRFSPMWIPDFYAYHAEIADGVQDELTKAASLVDEKFTLNTTYNIQPKSSHSIHRSYDRCYFMQTVPVVGADLGVYACHNKAYDHTGMIGSIHDQRFKELWFSEETRRYFLEFDPKSTCRHECANDGKNILINSLLDASVDNFV